MPYCELKSYRFEVRVKYEAEADLQENATTFRIKRVEARSLWGDVGNCWMIGAIRINGTVAAKMELGNTISCGFLLRDEFGGGGPGEWNGYTGADVAVSHNPDGTVEDAVFAISLSIRVTGGDVLEPSVNGSVKVSVPRIPRVSTLSAEGVELGKTMTIRLNRAASGFRDRVAWRCGSESGVLAEKTGDEVLNFAPPVALAAQAPNSTGVPVALTVTTYSGDVEIGSGELTVTCRVPDSVVPTASVAVTDKLGYASEHGGYIRGKSQARVVTQAAGVYGSTIREIAVTCGSSAGSGADVAFALNAAGTVNITVTVTDSRGRKTVRKTAIQVLAYDVPTAVIRRVYRCDETGSEQADGAWAAIVFDGTVTAVAGNTARYVVLRQVRGGEALPGVELTAYADQLRVSGGMAVLPAGIDSCYDCRISVQDSFATAESMAVTIPAAFVLLDLWRDGRAVGIGVRAKQEAGLSIGLDTDMDGHRLTDLPEPVENSEAATKGYVERRLQALASALGVTL